MPHLPPPPTTDELQQLWSRAAAIWDEGEHSAAFEGYVSADFPAIYDCLLELRTEGLRTFLEWGSGLGVVASMASRLGYEAYGIEIQAELIDSALELAAGFSADPIFGLGSFIPDDFVPQLHQGDEFHRTTTDELSAYDELDMRLSDFDVVYAYPWPEEHTVFDNILRRCGAAHVVYLRYDAREGLQVFRPNV